MKRLFDDPELPAELRGDLLRSRVGGEDYDAAAQLAPLRAALLDRARDPLAEHPKQAGTGSSWYAPTAWKLVAVLAAVGGTAALLARPAREQPAAPAVQVQTPSAPEPEPEPAAAVPEPALLQPTAAVVPSASSSRREIAQLVRIRALLGRDPAAAYRLAQRSQQEFPRGVLSEERQALSVIALHDSGAKQAAERSARAFFARYPDSPLRELVSEALRR